MTRTLAHLGDTNPYGPGGSSERPCGLGIEGSGALGAGPDRGPEIGGREPCGQRAQDGEEATRRAFPGRSRRGGACRRGRAAGNCDRRSRPDGRGGAADPGSPWSAPRRRRRSPARAGRRSSNSPRLPAPSRNTSAIPRRGPVLPDLRPPTSRLRPVRRISGIHRPPLRFRHEAEKSTSRNFRSRAATTRSNPARSLASRFSSLNRPASPTKTGGSTSYGERNAFTIGSARARRRVVTAGGCRRRASRGGRGRLRGRGWRRGCCRGRGCGVRR